MEKWERSTVNGYKKYYLQTGFTFGFHEKILIDTAFLNLGLIPPSVCLKNALKDYTPEERRKFFRKFRKFFKKNFKQYTKRNNQDYQMMQYLKYRYGIGRKKLNEAQLVARYNFVFKTILKKLRL